MADQFSKETILNKLKAKVQAKGFELNPDKSQMSDVVVTILDALDIMAESIADIYHNDQSKGGTIKARTLSFGPEGLQQPFAYKEAQVTFDATTDPQFFAWLEAFHNLLQVVYPEGGWGAPSTFAMALKALLALKPSSLTGKISQGSGTVDTTT